MDHHRRKSAFQGTNSRENHNCSVKKDIFDRLSTPKSKDIRWIPDRPSVYWLDYLIDQTPHMIKDPQELASYYDNFEPQFPRMKSLSTPRPYYGTLRREDDEANEKPMSRYTGIPISALTYNASDRIKDLARPKTTVSADKSAPPNLEPDRASRRIETISTARRHSPKGNEQHYFDPNVDFARGDFPSRSKHTIHTNYSGNKRVVGRDAKERDESKKESFLLNTKKDDVLTRRNVTPRTIQDVFHRRDSQERNQSRTNIYSTFKNDDIRARGIKQEQGLAKGEYLTKNCAANERLTKPILSRRHPNAKGNNSYVERRKVDNTFTARNTNISSRPGSNFRETGSSVAITTREILRNDKKQPMMSRTLYSGRY